MITDLKRVSTARKRLQEKTEEWASKVQFPVVRIESPGRNERIARPSYTMRIDAPAHLGQVEVSIDHGAWRPCRYHTGHWWYDWAGYESGEHQVVARIPTPEGQICISWPHKFWVQLDPH